MKPETDSSKRPLFFSLEVFNPEKSGQENFDSSQAVAAAKKAKASADVPLAQVTVAYEAPYETLFQNQFWRNKEGRWYYPEATEKVVSKAPDGSEYITLRVPEGEGDECLVDCFQDFHGFQCPWFNLGFPELSLVNKVHHAPVSKQANMVMPPELTARLAPELVLDTVVPVPASTPVTSNVKTSKTTKNK